MSTVSRGKDRVNVDSATDPRVALLGFDMSAMKEEVYGEAIVDIVKPESLVSDPVIIKVRESWIEKKTTRNALTLSRIIFAD
jgi:hypothetical protein